MADSKNYDFVPLVTSIKSLSDDERQELFFRAAYTGNFAQLKDCVAYGGIDVNRLNADGAAALHTVASKSDYDATVYLLGLPGIDRQIRTAHGFTPLHMACLTAVDPFYVRFLLAKGFDPNVGDRLGRRPIQYCIEKDCLLVTHWLAEFGAEVNFSDDLGNSPLSVAILDRSNFDMASLLLKHNADPHLDRGTGTPLLFDCILACTDYNAFKNLLLLLKHDTNLHVVHRLTRRNALHYASIPGYRPCVRELLHRGVDVRAIDMAGKTPSDLARDHGHFDVLYMYIEAMTEEEGLAILKTIDYEQMRRGIQVIKQEKLM